MSQYETDALKIRLNSNSSRRCNLRHNFRAAGALAIAPASSAKGEFPSVIRFDLAAALGQFNATYGSNNWTVTGITLQPTSNYGTAGVTILWQRCWHNRGRSWRRTCTRRRATICPCSGRCHSRRILSQRRPAAGRRRFGFAQQTTRGYLFNSYKYGRGHEPLIQVVAAPRLPISSGVFTNQAFHLTGIGNNDATYNVQAATNLAPPNWMTTGTATASDAGVVEFDDTNALTQPQRLYRLSQ
jgi:hypothetical protein